MIYCTEIQHGSSEYWEAVSLRDQVLRKPLGLVFCTAELEAEADSHHLGCYEDRRLVGCLVLNPVDNQIFKMRQVAVVADCQGQGIGRQLVHYAEEFACSIGASQMVMHARETAVGFYQKLGYIQEGELFVEVTLPHYFLRKSLHT